MGMIETNTTDGLKKTAINIDTTCPGIRIDYSYSISKYPFEVGACPG